MRFLSHFRVFCPRRCVLCHPWSRPPLSAIVDDLYLELVQDQLQHLVEADEPDASLIEAAQAFMDDTDLVDVSAVDGVPVESSSVLCPLCQTRWLFQSATRVFCRCGALNLRRSDTVCLATLETQLSAACQRHMAACTHNPQFHLRAGTLQMNCKVCGMTAPVAM